MYIGLGKNKFTDTENIIGIFDLDITSQSHLTRKYLSASEKSGSVENAAEDLPKSFVVCAEKSDSGEKIQKVYLSQMSAQTLLKHVESGIL